MDKGDFRENWCSESRILLVRKNVFITNFHLSFDDFREKRRLEDRTFL